MRAAFALLLALLLAGCLGGGIKDRVCIQTFPGGELVFPWDGNVSKVREALTADGWTVTSPEAQAPIGYTEVNLTRGDVHGWGSQASGGADAVTYRILLQAPPPAKTAQESQAALGPTMKELQVRFGGAPRYTGGGMECS